MEDINQNYLSYSDSPLIETYDHVSIDGEAFKLEQSNECTIMMKNALKHKIEALDRHIKRISSTNAITDIDFMPVDTLTDDEVGIVLRSQHTDSYKPFLLTPDSYWEISNKIESILNSNEPNDKEIKFDFVSYAAHCLPISVRIVDGKVHVISVDYIQYENNFIKYIKDSNFKDKAVFHYFSPDDSLQADGMSCATFAVYALKEISNIPTNQIEQYIPSAHSTDFTKLSPNLMRLTQVISKIDQYVEANPGAVVHHKKKADEALSDYVKRNTLKFASKEDDEESENYKKYKLIKSNIAVHNKTLKIYKSCLKALSVFKDDRELAEYMTKCVIADDILNAAS